MPLYDATLLLTAEMATWPGEPGPDRRLIKSLADGDPANVSQLTLGVHSGTHIDAPVHFLAGAGGIETIPVEALVGPGLVVDCGDAPALTAELAGKLVPRGTERVLFKTRNSAFFGSGAFREDFTYIAHDAAQALVERGLRLVAIDYLSVEQFNAAEPLTHRTLLAAGVAIVEGAYLRDVPPGEYEVMALPIKLAGSDGAPARLLLRS